MTCIIKLYLLRRVNVNEFRDKQVEIGRLYLFAAPLVLLVGYIISLASVLLNAEYEIGTDISNPLVSNIVGSLGLGYGLSCEATIIYIYIQLFRKNKKPIKVLLTLLLIPAMIICVFPALVATIPYYVYSYNKTRKIAIDNRPVFSKKKIIALICVLIAAVIVTVVSLLV